LWEAKGEVLSESSATSISEVIRGANRYIASRIGPSMIRPSRVKSFCSFRDFFFFSGSARPPLSPPFHPHSYGAIFRSVLVGCSRLQVLLPEKRPLLPSL
jgi:hypothetical protein